MSERNVMKKIVMTAGLVLWATGCTPLDDGAVSADESACADAAAHLQACFPGESPAAPDACTAESAEEILAKDCDVLSAQASANEGKADGFCNPWFWWTCGFSGGSTEPETVTYDVNFQIAKCQSELCVEDLFGERTDGGECGKITLENEAGEVVATDYINDYLFSGGVQGTGAGFRDMELPAGEYVAKLWRRDGTQAVTVKSEPAEFGVTLGEDGSVDQDGRYFKILDTEADLIRACSDVYGSLTSTCDMEPMEDEEVEWGWLVRIDGQNGEGTYLDMRRARSFRGNPHSYVFRRVRPGDYTLTFIEMDVPSWRRELNMDFEDYEYLAERYATGRELVQEIQITDEDIVSEDVTFSSVDLDHQECF